jgi:multicomponent Na+:H+ antiporter subunit G
MIEVLGWISLCVGVGFTVLGCLGLVRFPDLYNRMQAATKCVTLGTCGIMLGVFLKSGFSSLGVKALLCALFVLITVPVAAHALARGSLIFGVKLWKHTVKDEFTDDRGGEPIIEGPGTRDEGRGAA